jgi:hypothetical protein
MVVPRLPRIGSGRPLLPPGRCNVSVMNVAPLVLSITRYSWRAIAAPQGKDSWYLLNSSTITAKAAASLRDPQRFIRRTDHRFCEDEQAVGCAISICAW